MPIPAAPSVVLAACEEIERAIDVQPCSLRFDSAAPVWPTNTSPLHLIYPRGKFPITRLRGHLVDIGKYWARYGWSDNPETLTDCMRAMFTNYVALGCSSSATSSSNGWR